MSLHEEGSGAPHFLHDLDLCVEPGTLDALGVGAGEGVLVVKLMEFVSCWNPRRPSPLYGVGGDMLLDDGEEGGGSAVRNPEVADVAALAEAEDPGAVFSVSSVAEVERSHTTTESE